MASSTSGVKHTSHYNVASSQTWNRVASSDLLKNLWRHFRSCVPLKSFHINNSGMMHSEAIKSDSPVRRSETALPGAFYSEYGPWVNDGNFIQRTMSRPAPNSWSQMLEGRDAARDLLVHRWPNESSNERLAPCIKLLGLWNWKIPADRSFKLRYPREGLWNFPHAYKTARSSVIRRSCSKPWLISRLEQGS